MLIEVAWFAFKVFYIDIVSAVNGIFCHLDGKIVFSQVLVFFRQDYRLVASGFYTFKNVLVHFKEELVQISIKLFAFKTLLDLFWLYFSDNSF